MTEAEAAAAREESMPRWIALFDEIGKADPNVQGRELVERGEAKVVRVVDGETVVTDGPFAETKEQLGGVFITDLPDLDEAIRHRRARSRRRVRHPRDPAADQPVTERVAAVYAEEWPRCVAILTRVLGDLERAEDAVQDAFATALERWPQTGIPDNPGAWIVTTARNRAIDRIRRERVLADKTAVLARLESLPADPDEMSALPDERLALVFTCCHPALAADVQIALTLRIVGGLTTTEIAAAFLVPEQTMAQRLVRAKTQDPHGRDPVPRPRRRDPAGPAHRGAARDLPDLQRGLCGEQQARPSSVATSAARRSGWRSFCAC